MADSDPLHLWNTVRNTHLSARTLSTRQDKHKASQAYATLRMGPYDKLDAYKLRFDSAIQTLRACQVDLPPTDDIITKFIESLNSNYDELKLRIRNDEFSGLPNAWPSTLDAAYIRASKFVTTATLIQKTDTVEKTIAFIGTADSLSQKRKQLATDKKKRNPGPRISRTSIPSGQATPNPPPPGTTQNPPTVSDKPTTDNSTSPDTKAPNKQIGRAHV